MLLDRLQEMSDLVQAIDNALEAEMNNQPATAEQLKQLYGNHFDDAYAQEAESRWGATPEWKQAASRTEKYTVAEWTEIKAEEDAINDAFITAMRADQAPNSDAAMKAAEAHLEHISSRFYELDHQAHAAMAQLYVSDPRFSSRYDTLEPGLAQYMRDAIVANAERRG